MNSRGSGVFHLPRVRVGGQRDYKQIQLLFIQHALEFDVATSAELRRKRLDLLRLAAAASYQLHLLREARQRSGMSGRNATRTQHSDAQPIHRPSPKSIMDCSMPGSPRSSFANNSGASSKAAV